MCGARRSGLSSTGQRAGCDLVDLGADRGHCGDKSVQLGEVLGLCRLDHQRARDRKAHRGCVEAEVDEPLGDVVDGHAGRRRQGAQVEDALVGDQAALAGVQDWEVRGQPSCQVVRAEHGDLRGLGQSGGPHHPDVGPGDGQDPCGTVRRCAHRADAAASGRVRVERVGRQVRHEVGRHSDRPDAGTTASVRDAERLVQVQVRHVTAELTGLRHTEQRVEVRAVDVHLSAVVGVRARRAG